MDNRVDKVQMYPIWIRFTDRIISHAAILLKSACTEPQHNTAKHKPWASYQIRKIAGCACAGNAGNVFPRRRFQRKLLVSDPGMHHGTCVTHVPWCMSGSLTCGDGENVPGIPGACAPAILRIWQEAHAYGIVYMNIKTDFNRLSPTSNISHTFVGDKLVDHSDVVGASPVGAAPIISSFST